MSPISSIDWNDALAAKVVNRFGGAFAKTIRGNSAYERMAMQKAARSQQEAMVCASADKSARKSAFVTQAVRVVRVRCENFFGGTSHGEARPSADLAG